MAAIESKYGGDMGDQTSGSIDPDVGRPSSDIDAVPRGRKELASRLRRNDQEIHAAVRRMVSSREELTSSLVESDEAFDAMVRTAIAMRDKVAANLLNHDTQVAAVIRSILSSRNAVSKSALRCYEQLDTVPRHESPIGAPPGRQDARSRRHTDDVVVDDAESPQEDGPLHD